MEISPIFTVLGIINTVISVIACPIIAGNKNRSVAGWIFGGLFLGLIGLLIVACLPKEKNSLCGNRHFQPSFSYITILSNTTFYPN
jgi:hypothetical protein